MCIRDRTLVVHLGDVVHLGIGLGDELLLLGRDGRVDDGDGQGAFGGIFVTLGLDGVEHLGGAGCAVDLDAFFHDLGQALLIRLEIDLILEHIVDGVPLDKPEILRDRLVEDDPADGGFHQAVLHHAVDFQETADLDLGMQADHMILIRLSLIHI